MFILLFINIWITSLFTANSYANTGTSSVAAVACTLENTYRIKEQIPTIAHAEQLLEQIFTHKQSGLCLYFDIPQYAEAFSQHFDEALDAYDLPRNTDYSVLLTSKNDFTSSEVSLMKTLVLKKPKLPCQHALPFIEVGTDVFSVQPSVFKAFAQETNLHEFKSQSILNYLKMTSQGFLLGTISDSEKTFYLAVLQEYLNRLNKPANNQDLENQSVFTRFKTWLHENYFKVYQIDLKEIYRHHGKTGVVLLLSYLTLEILEKPIGAAGGALLSSFFGISAKLGSVIGGVAFHQEYVTWPGFLLLVYYSRQLARWRTADPTRTFGNSELYESVKRFRDRKLLQDPEHKGLFLTVTTEDSVFKFKIVKDTFPFSAPNWVKGLSVRKIRKNPNLISIHDLEEIISDTSLLKNIFVATHETYYSSASSFSMYTQKLLHTIKNNPEYNLEFKKLISKKIKSTSKNLEEMEIKTDLSSSNTQQDSGHWVHEIHFFIHFELDDYIKHSPKAIARQLIQIRKNLLQLEFSVMKAEMKDETELLKELRVNFENLSMKAQSLYRNWRQTNFSNQNHCDGWLSRIF